MELPSDPVDSLPEHQCIPPPRKRHRLSASGIQLHRSDSESSRGISPTCQTARNRQGDVLVDSDSLAPNEELYRNESCSSTPSISGERSPDGSITSTLSSAHGSSEMTDIDADSWSPSASRKRPLMKPDRPERLCYGMLKLPVEARSVRKLLGSRSKVSAYLSGRCVYMEDNDAVHLGHLHTRQAHIMRKLAETDGVLLQFEVCRHLQESVDSLDVRRKTSKLVLELSIYIYGPLCHAYSVGMFLLEFELYLQDPPRCDLEVPYHNPQSLWATMGHESREIQNTAPVSEQKKFEAPSDLLQDLEYGEELARADDPSALRTKLHNHQCQALYFMLNREAGWNFQGPLDDIWHKQASLNDVKYVNTVTGEEQSSPPPNFRGGILADQMGLGKTLSIIALIASDKDEGKSLVQCDKDETVNTTLIVVRAPLIHMWEAQLNQHILPGRLRWRRHYEKARLSSATELDAIDIVLTTYQTLVSEFGKCENQSLQLAFKTKWRRVVLDEAHEIRNRNCATAKAMRSLEAVSRWAITGTPVQNDFSDIASLYQFLRIEPYKDEPTLVKGHMKQLAEDRDPDDALLKTRRLIRCITLRRSLQVVELPKREDLIHHLIFSPEEAEIYDQARTRTGALFNDIRRDGSQFHILSWIENLRMICNLGTRAKQPEVRSQPTDNIRSISVAQEMFHNLVITGRAVCCSCSTDLATVPAEVADCVSDVSTHTQLASCSYLVCGPCTQKQDGAPRSCTHSPPHEMQPVSRSSSSAFSSSDTDDHMRSTASMPTKVKALILDLEQHINNEKCVVFSFWTRTLDVIQEYIRQRSIEHIRFDGKVSNEERKKVLVSFKSDTHVRVALVSISCGAVGLDLTSASRAYLMEPQWNPSVEQQALARIYRMGQTRKVTTIRYVMRDSIEDNVLDIQSRKQGISDMLLSLENQGNHKTPIDQLKLKQLQSLILGKSVVTRRRLLCTDSLTTE